MSDGRIAINKDNCKFCYIDIDIDRQREKLALAASFVDATDSRYGFSSKDLRCLGGAELARIEEAITNDHGKISYLFHFLIDTILSCAK